VIIPYLVSHGGHEHGPDDELLAQRTVLVHGEIDEQVANVATAKILYLQHRDPAKEIRIFLDSPGGSVTGALAIYDVMRFVKNEIATYALGQTGGMAVLLLAAGTKGKRFALPHARFTFTPLTRGPGAVQTQEVEVARLRTNIFKLLSQHTGQPFEVVERLHSTLTHRGAAEAVQLGLVDEVVTAIPGS